MRFLTAIFLTTTMTTIFGSSEDADNPSVFESDLVAPSEVVHSNDPLTPPLTGPLAANLPTLPLTSPNAGSGVPSSMSSVEFGRRVADLLPSAGSPIIPGSSMPKPPILQGQQTVED